MTKQTQICDNCETEAKLPVYRRKGWMHFNTIKPLLSTGKAYMSKDLTSLDFCSLKCFGEWLAKQSK